MRFLNLNGKKEQLDVCDPDIVCGQSIPIFDLSPHISRSSAGYLHSQIIECQEASTQAQALKTQYIRKSTTPNFHMFFTYQIAPNVSNK